MRRGQLYNIIIFSINKKICEENFFFALVNFTTKKIPTMKCANDEMQNKSKEQKICIKEKSIGDKYYKEIEVQVA